MNTTNTSLIKKLLLLFLVFAGLYYAKTFLMPLFIGGILATLFLPFCNWMEKKKTPKGLSVFICLLSLLSLITSVFVLLGWKIYALLDDFVLIKKVSIQTFEAIQIYIYNHLDLTYKEQSQILMNEQPSYTNIMQMLLGSLAYFFTNLILILVYFLFLLYYRVHIKIFFLKQTMASQRNEMEQLIDSAANVSQQYLLGISKMIVLLWIMYGIGFSVIGVENALFFAILCGLLEIVPYVGNITGTLITVVVAGLHGANLSMLGGIVLVYIAIQMIQGWILEPLILGPQVKINPLFTIFALVLGELLWGIPGVVLAIPVTAIIKIMCDHIETLKPYGFLIGETESEKTEKGLLRRLKMDILSSNKK
ncbi:AI-2E family transporter [Flavobacterium sp.]|uniref:AI-2E family transporter n=1 Tax=Flavobacterium sp. TaxID=239 RepID=UPI00286C830F|nr:AI-2E family transporter [Flavobacterium sp.]